MWLLKASTSIGSSFIRLGVFRVYIESLEGAVLAVLGTGKCDFANFIDVEVYRGQQKSLAASSNTVFMKFL